MSLVESLAGIRKSCPAAALCLAVSSVLVAGEKPEARDVEPSLLQERTLPPVKSNLRSNIDPQSGPDDEEESGEKAAIPPSSTPEAVERYRIRLEERLFERYNNLPEFAGKVGRVTVILSKPVEPSLDGRLLRAEFDQLVYDNWGVRLPRLEKEYYVVVFGSGGAELVRSDPSIRIGLEMEKTYSERVPLAADPFRNVPDDEAFGKTEGTARMPDWWRPEPPEE